MRAKGEVPSRTALHPHSRAPSLINLQLSPNHHPQQWLKTPSSLTQPRPYLASRAPQNPHADAHRALACLWLRFSVTRPDPFVSHLSWVWNISEPQTRMEVSVGTGVDSPCERTGKALIQALRDDVRLLTLLKPELDAEVELELLDDRTNS
ncbi:hypothetical protein K443DRAFT_15416 [Laccaria amethystina LaAM-08-1]|uniref:Uncharacterized protein n=1 Tax=Laccaria amethystina LaAM-08-1 TaxID=1095629 RepID=A0A0C9X0X6_9AGAR|nr:hypothetical protein K443DRAFT_15416 [Laccaria amethystina LaAM-08-1]